MRVTALQVLYIRQLMVHRCGTRRELSVMEASMGISVISRWKRRIGVCFSVENLVDHAVVPRGGAVVQTLRV